jgi:hypothetical protein
MSPAPTTRHLGDQSVLIHNHVLLLPLRLCLLLLIIIVESHSLRLMVPRLAAAAAKTARTTNHT